MRILIEECRYDPKVLEGVLPRDRLLLTDEKVKVEHVGYFRSAECDDFVFFLPKVVLEPKMIDGEKVDRVFCTAARPLGFSPEALIDPETAVAEDGHGLEERERDFLYEFAVWIYRAIARFDETHPGSDAIWRRRERQSGGFRRRYVTNTLLDVILALIRFNRDNQDYFTFRVKEKHSGVHKINWSRTISKTTALLQDGDPLYLEPRTKKKVVNFDEELLVIFYSILDYVNRHYGFKERFNLAYDLIPAAEFKRYLSGYGEARLRQIKYKYFSDRDLALWELCFAFFHKSHRANVVNEGEEYLIAKNFEIIFESMIDDLIGDRDLDPIRELRDGKEIDHLYVDDSLTHRDGRQTFYIADSKYYKIGRALEEKSVAKQFTYARDMLQLNLDLFLPGDDASASVLKGRRLFDGKSVKMLRDPDTEGYDVIPNFFISARMEKDFDYDQSGLNLRTGGDDNEYQNIHFHNRLFDRDTLILSHYEVNFLYVVKLYAGSDAELRQGWKADVRRIFQEHVRDLIQGRFEFRAIMPHDGIDPKVFFAENFRMTLGKVYSPYADVNGRKVYMLAVQRPSNIFYGDSMVRAGREHLKEQVEAENKATLRLLETAFYVTEPLALGEDPSEELAKMESAHPVRHGPAHDGETGVQVVSGVSGGLKSAVDASGWCPCPAAQCPDPEAVKLLVLPHTMGANLYRVVDGTLRKDVMEEGFKEVVGEAFAAVRFPSMPCHLWRVVKVEG